mgnify:CR=1 FL=1
MILNRRDSLAMADSALALALNDLGEELLLGADPEVPAPVRSAFVRVVKED